MMRLTAVFAAILWTSSPASAADCGLAAEPAAREIQMSPSVDGVQIAYRIHGPAHGRDMLLLPGIGMQLIEWPPELIEGLIDQGFRVIAVDLRDSGASTHFSAAGMPDWAKILPALGEGRQPLLAYSAYEMKNDLVALLDGLGIERADVLGLSGGATIGELLAIDHPSRVRSLNLVAANSGNAAVPIPADPKQFEGQAQPYPGEPMEAAVVRRVDTARRLAGKGAVFDMPCAEPMARRAHERDPDPFGTMRQGVALLALFDLRSRLAAITAPTLVIHGALDPLIAPELGREVAEAVPGARFLLIDGMGHNIPAAQISDILSAVQANASRAD